MYSSEYSSNPLSPGASSVRTCLSLGESQRQTCSLQQIFTSNPDGGGTKQNKPQILVREEPEDGTNLPELWWSGEHASVTYVTSRVSLTRTRVLQVLTRTLDCCCNLRRDREVFGLHRKPPLAYTAAIHLRGK